MNNKMRVGRLKSDGSWSGAIGAYLESKKAKARVENKGREKGRQSGAPGDGSNANRARVLRVLSRIAHEGGHEWVHELQASHWMETFEAVVEEIAAHPKVRGEVKPNTVNNVISTLRAFARHVAEERAISARRLKQILQSLPAMRESEEQYLVLPKDEWEKLFGHARLRHPVELVFLALPFFTGMRSSEIRRLMWHHIKFGSHPRVVFPRDKRHGQMHTVPLPKELIAILMEWQEWLKDHCNVDSIPGDWYVVPARRKGARMGNNRRMNPDWPVDPTRPLNRNSATEWAKKAMREFGYRDEETLNQACHTFRRSGAEEIFQQTGDVRLVSRWLGHGKRNKPNVQTTMGYLGNKETDEALRAVLDGILTRDNKLALPAGSEVIEVGPEDILDKPSPKAAIVSSIEQLDDEELWDGIAHRYTAEEILREGVFRTAHLPWEEQLDYVMKFRKRYDRAIERAQLKLLAA